MKNLICYSIAAVGLLGLASCAQDDVTAPAGDGVNLTVRLPRDMQTRGTFGDGTDGGDRAVLNNLQWSVYEVVNGEVSATPLFSDGKSAFAASQTEETVNLPLAKGKTYQIAFYADDSNNNFVTYTDGVINVDYANGASNTAAEDAFIGRSVQFTVDGAYSETVVLTRPFAQLNWGTDDLNTKALEEVLKSLTASVKVSNGLYSSMNVLSGDVVPASAVTAPVQFGAVSFASLPTQTFPVSGYDLIAMNYLLTGNGTIDCELSFDNGLSPVTVNSAPVQVNHRTNIYGSLLTAPADFEIIVDNNFDTPDNDLLVKESVKTPEELADALANAENGDVIELGADMTMPLTGALTIDKDVTLVVPAGVTVSTSRQGNTANFVVATGNTVTLKGEGSYSGDNRIFDVNGTLVVDGPTFNTSTKTRGSAITVNAGGELTFKSGTINAARCALFVEGKVTLNGGKLVSTNSSQDPEVGPGQWGYCVELAADSSDVTINGGEVEGVHGALALSYGKLTVNGGYFHTHHSQYSNSDNYYALSIRDGQGGVANINGGEFYAENQYAVSMTQRAGYEPYVLNLKGGKFNNKGYVANADGTTGTTLPSAGYEWKEINDGNFKFEVVPAN